MTDDQREEKASDWVMKVNDAMADGPALTAEEQRALGEWLTNTRNLAAYGYYMMFAERLRADIREQPEKWAPIIEQLRLKPH